MGSESSNPLFSRDPHPPASVALCEEVSGDCEGLAELGTHATLD